jgi:hypothetical protein
LKKLCEGAVILGYFRTFITFEQCH